MREYNFNAEKEKNQIINWIKDYFAKPENAHHIAVIGISGGKDSSIATGILVEALGKERVFGVLMPQGHQHDFDTAMEVVDYFNIDYTVMNIGHICDVFYEELVHGKIDPKGENKIIHNNTPARIRMAMLYAVAAEVGGRVVNTCNLSEDYVGYSTKWGDNVGDFSIFTYYTATEVKQIGETLGLPNHFIHKTPEDGLSGKSDEENFGFTYNTLDKYIRQIETPNIESLEKIKKLYNTGLHKSKAVHLPNPGTPRGGLIFGYDDYEF